MFGSGLRGMPAIAALAGLLLPPTMTPVLWRTDALALILMLGVFLAIG